MTLDNINELYWIAGLIEGEGSFGIQYIKRKDGSKNPQPRFQIHMNDRDVLERFASIMGYGNVTGPYYRGVDGRQGWYAWHVSGKRCLELAARIKPLMGERRTKKIDELLDICG